jgi:hypothetical protein
LFALLLIGFCIAEASAENHYEPPFIKKIQGKIFWKSFAKKNKKFLFGIFLTMVILSPHQPHHRNAPRPPTGMSNLIRDETGEEPLGSSTCRILLGKVRQLRSLLLNSGGARGGHHPTRKKFSAGKIF